MNLFRKRVMNDGSVNPWLTGPSAISDDEFILTASTAIMPTGTAALILDGPVVSYREERRVHRCSYCGRRSEARASACDGCGAPL